MIKPEDQGNPAVPVMQLVQQLEGKVREKNATILAIQEEADYYRRRWLATEIVWGSWSPLVIGLVGMVVGWSVGWWMR